MGRRPSTVAAGRMHNDLASGGVQCVLLFCHTYVLPIVPPSGKAEEKARATQLVPTDAYPVWNGLFLLLFVLFASSRLH